MDMKYTITIPKEFRYDYIRDKFKDTFERLLADIEGKADDTTLKKVNQLEQAFLTSEATANDKVTVFLPFEDKPEDILKAASSKLTTIYPYLCGRYERETIDMLNTAFKDAGINKNVEKLNYIWKHINEFLYENGKPTLRHGKPGVLIEHTEQEYIDFLNGLAQDSLESYRNFAIEYGWIDAPVPKSKLNDDYDDYGR